MQKLFFIITFLIVTAMFSCLMPYPVFSNLTNITEKNLTMINNFNESELENFETEKMTVLNLKQDYASALLDGTFEIYDMLSGMNFSAMRTGGKNHVDFELLNCEFPFEASWKCRPALVKVCENGYIPASFSCYPHGYSMLNGRGHFCLHFDQSKTDGTEKESPEHQKCIKYAKKHASEFLNQNLK